MASSLGFALGRRIWVLLAGRILQSMSTTAIRCSGLATLKDAVGVDAQGRALGFVAMSTTAGMLAGPAISGLIYAKLGYGMVWAVIGSLITLDVLSRSLMQNPADLGNEHKQAIDDNLSPSEETEEVQYQQNNEWSPLLKRDQSERKSTLTLLSQLFRRRQMIIAIYFAILSAFLLSSFESVLPLFLKEQLQFNSAQVSGLFIAAFAPLGLAPFVERLSSRYSVRLIVFLGLAFAAPGFTCLRFINEPSKPQVALLISLLVLCGLGCTTLTTLCMVECGAAASRVEREEQDKDGDSKVGASAFATLNTATSVGHTLGPFAGGLMNVSIGWKGLVLVLGVVCGVSAAIILVFGSSRRTRFGGSESEPEASSA